VTAAGYLQAQPPKYSAVRWFTHHHGALHQLAIIDQQTTQVRYSAVQQLWFLQ
jgi:hypothetical protein